MWDWFESGELAGGGGGEFAYIILSLIIVYMAYKWITKDE